MRSRTVAGLMALGMLAAGCGNGGGGGGTSPSPSASGTTPAASALTETQARAIFAKYQKVNNQANAHLSAATLSTIETGAMLKGDLADYKVTRAGLDSKIKPFTYHSARFYLPRDADWFAVDAKPSNGDGEEFLVFAKTGGTYKLATSAWKNKASFPTIARGADGSATAVTTPATAKLAAAHSEYLSNVAAGLRGSGFAAGALTSKLGAQWHGYVNKITQDGAWRGGTTWKAADYPVYALATADGGAFVWYTATQSLDYSTVNPTAWYRPDKPFFAFGPKKYRHDYHGTWLWRFAAHLPKDGGATAVLASGRLPVGASGS
ncbi:hypothetical protein [Actinoallomurus sp. CA-142502]|uniref:hypothetical protein n=1 Tax=Actinoallomurus sp. CA-142502 TaxID=3239885 RepID=UPI003D93EDDB